MRFCSQADETVWALGDGFGGAKCSIRPAGAERRETCGEGRGYLCEALSGVDEVAGAGQGIVDAVHGRRQSSRPGEESTVSCGEGAGEVIGSVERIEGDAELAIAGAVERATTGHTTDNTPTTGHTSN